MMYRRVYLDMDGVIADFHGHFLNCYSVSSSEYKKKHSLERYWEKIYENPLFFQEIPPFKWLDELLSDITMRLGPITILSSPSRTNQALCLIQKRAWVDNYLGPYQPAIFETNKHIYAAEDTLLIDDTPYKINKFKEAGGNTHLFTNYENFGKEFFND